MSQKYNVISKTESSELSDWLASPMPSYLHYDNLRIYYLILKYTLIISLVLKNIMKIINVKKGSHDKVNIHFF